MAVDTRQKRTSAVHAGLAWARPLPSPAGSVGQASRQHTAGAYSGISAVVVELIVSADTFHLLPAGPDRHLLPAWPDRHKF